MKSTDFQVGRITIVESSISKYDNKGCYLKNLFSDFVSKVPLSTHISILITPAALIRFALPSTLIEDIMLVDQISLRQLKMIENIAAEKITTFIAELGVRTFKKLSSVVDYLTIGIDGEGSFSRSSRKVELVAIYDLKQNKIIHWTGKFYPSSDQGLRVIRYPKLNSHFIKLDGKKIMILGCHDLNVFNPRGKEKITGWREEVYHEFMAHAQRFKPEVVIQHPHITNSKRIWRNGWKNIERALPSVETYASGIRTFNDKHRNDKIEDIQRLTKKGIIFEYTYRV